MAHFNTPRRRFHRSVPSLPSLVGALLAALFLLTVSACGAGGEDRAEVPSDSEPGTATGPQIPEPYPLVVAAANGEVIIDERPQRIISLSPTATEMLFAIGADEQVMAVDNMSDYPPGVPTSELSGFEPNVEAIVAMSPDLIVLADDGGPGASDPVVEALGSLNIPVILAPAATNMDDTYEQIELLGVATDHPVEADELVGRMREDIAAALETAPETDQPLKIYHEVDPTPFSATSTTFIGQVYDSFGLINIADAADVASGYPQLSVEHIVTQNPDLIFLADTVCCQQTADTVAARDGWGQVAAVQHGHIFSIDDAVATRWGPRIVEMYQEVAKALATLR